jgi:hypothetical protein
MNKGEIFIWLTDDNRKVPVLMKSTISIGSIVSTLTKIRPGREVTIPEYDASRNVLPGPQR